MHRLRQFALLIMLTLVALVAGLLTGPAAGATVIHEVDTAGHGTAVTLASTGFNITGPVLIGLGFLVVGIALVSWAFLRSGGSARRRHH